MSAVDVCKSQSSESFLHNVYMGPPSRTKVSIPFCMLYVYHFLFIFGFECLRYLSLFGHGDYGETLFVIFTPLWRHGV